MVLVTALSLLVEEGLLLGLLLADIFSLDFEWPISLLLLVVLDLFLGLFMVEAFSSSIFFRLFFAALFIASFVCEAISLLLLLDFDFDFERVTGPFTLDFPLEGVCVLTSFFRIDVFLEFFVFEPLFERDFDRDLLVCERKTIGVGSLEMLLVVEGF